MKRMKHTPIRRKRHHEKYELRKELNEYETESVNISIPQPRRKKIQGLSI